MTTDFINNSRRTFKYFYIARMRDGRCKVGVSHAPEGRCNDMGATLLAQVPCIRPFEIEQEAKALFFGRVRHDHLGELGTETFPMSDAEVWLLWHYAHSLSSEQIRSSPVMDRSWPDKYGEPVEIEPSKPDASRALRYIQKIGIDAWNAV